MFAFPERIPFCVLGFTNIIGNKFGTQKQSSRSRLQLGLLGQVLHISIILIHCLWSVLLVILRLLLRRFVTLFLVLVTIALGQFVVTNPEIGWEFSMRKWVARLLSLHDSGSGSRSPMWSRILLEAR